MFWLIKQAFIKLLRFSRSLASIVNASDHTKCVSLNSQQCMTQLTLIYLHHNEYGRGLRYYPFAVNLDRCVGSCNTLSDLSNRVCVCPNKTEDSHLNVFNMITGINKSRTSTKHISCEYKRKFGGRKCNSNVTGITINVGVSVIIQKNIMCTKRTILGILLHVVVKMVNI